MENSEALVLFSELSRATVESRLKVLVQLLLTKYGPILPKNGREVAYRFLALVRGTYRMFRAKFAHDVYRICNLQGQIYVVSTV